MTKTDLFCFSQQDSTLINLEPTTTGVAAEQVRP